MQALHALLTQATQDGTIPGAVVCVARRGTLLWHQAYGLAACTPVARPMQCQTLFDVASLTKVLVTTPLLLLAQQQGHLSLEMPLRTWYPQTAGSPLAQVSLRQLLAHTGGLTAWLPLYEHLCPAGSAPGSADGTQEPCQQAVALILRAPLAYAPGTATRYSDLGFILLGDILAKQYQERLDRLFVREVAAPLGLQQMGYRPLPGAPGASAASADYAATEDCPWRGRVLVGEVHDENAWAMGGVAGHAGLFATALSIWQFVHAMLEAAAGRCDWLAAPLLRTSWQRQDTPVGTTRALGWDTPTPGSSSAGTLFSADSIGHLGFTGCSLWIDLRQQVTVVLCTNRVHPSRHATGIRWLRPAVHNAVMRALV
ncbi:MAG: serine hydrolase domain-containing protein [Candidatus Tectimicrobiota bacterium]